MTEVLTQEELNNLLASVDEMDRKEKRRKVKSGYDLTLLHMVAINGIVEYAKSLISEGADVNAKDSVGRTPLHVTAINGNVEIAKILISAGADVNAKAIENSTPLHLAVYFKNMELIKFLISNGADTSIKDSKGHTPLESTQNTGNSTSAISGALSTEEMSK